MRVLSSCLDYQLLETRDDIFALLVLFTYLSLEGAIASTEILVRLKITGGPGNCCGRCLNSE